MPGSRRARLFLRGEYKISYDFSKNILDTMMKVPLCYKNMKTITVTEAETNFSDILIRVKNGEKFKILHDNFQESVAMIIPIEKNKASRKIGILDGSAKFAINGNGKISGEEFLGL